MYLDLLNSSTRAPTRRSSGARRSANIRGKKWASVEIGKIRVVMISVALLLLVSLSCALIPSPFVVIACFIILIIIIAAICSPRFALLLLFMSAGLPSITLPLPGHNIASG